MQAPADYQDIVVKVCSRAEEEISDSIQIERQVLSKLPKHPNIVEMVDFHQNKYKAYLVLKKAGDLTLQQFVK